MRTIDDIINITESTFHSSKAQRATADVKKIVKAIIKAAGDKLDKGLWQKCYQKWYNDCDERSYEILQNDLNGYRKILLVWCFYSMYTKGTGSMITTNLDSGEYKDGIELLTQKRGKGKAILKFADVIVGSSDFNGSLAHDDSRGRDSICALRIYVPRLRIKAPAGKFWANGFDFAASTEGMKRVQKWIEKVRSTIAHELTHFEQKMNSDKLDKKYMNRGLLKQLVEVISGPYSGTRIGYGLDQSELDAFYNGAYQEWRQSYDKKTHKRKSLLGIYIKHRYLNTPTVKAFCERAFNKFETHAYVTKINAVFNDVWNRKATQYDLENNNIKVNRDLKACYEQYKDIIELSVKSCQEIRDLSYFAFDILKDKKEDDVKEFLKSYKDKQYSVTKTFNSASQFLKEYILSGQARKNVEETLKELNLL